MTNRRWEIIDREHPRWRGNRFTDRSRALRELSHAVPPSRFYVRDRLSPVGHEHRWTGPFQVSCSCGERFQDPGANVPEGFDRLSMLEKQLQDHAFGVMAERHEGEG